MELKPEKRNLPVKNLSFMHRLRFRDSENIRITPSNKVISRFSSPCQFPLDSVQLQVGVLLQHPYRLSDEDSSKK